MKFQIDLTQVQELKPLPTGTYIIKLIECDSTKKSQQGNPKLVFKAEVLAPPDIAKEQKNHWFSLSLVESALFRLKQLMDAAGVPIRAGGFDTADLIGREVGYTVIVEETPQYGVRNQLVSFSPSKQTKPEVRGGTVAASAASPAAAASAAPVPSPGNLPK